MKVLLINPPIRLQAKAEVLPWGLVYVAQSLIEDGHQVQVLDVNAFRWEREEVLDKISELEFDLIGVGGLVTIYSYLKWITLELKKRYPQVPIIAGGTVASPMPELILSKTGVDIACIGEADVTVRELAKALESSKDLRAVKGLCFRDKEGPVRTPPRPYIQNLDEIPIPEAAYKLFPMETYIQNATQNATENTPIPDRYRRNNIRSLVIINSRGCPFSCNFCYNAIKGHRRHSIDYVIRHIHFLRDRYAINHFDFEDEHFTVNRRWVEEFCDRLVAEAPDICWRTGGRSDAIKDIDMVMKMKQAGCYSLSFGFESGSQAMLDAMNKKAKVDDNRRAAEMVRSANIALLATFIVGTPGETVETARETERFMRELDISGAGVFYCTPYPGSIYYTLALEKGLIRDEDEFIAQLGDAFKFVVNLTDLPDEVLMKCRYRITTQVMKNKLKESTRRGPMLKRLPAVGKYLVFSWARTLFIFFFSRRLLNFARGAHAVFRPI